MTFAVISPEHELINQIMEQSDKKDEIQNYLDSIVNKSEFERMSITKENWSRYHFESYESNHK